MLPNLQAIISVPLHLRARQLGALVADPYFVATFFLQRKAGPPESRHVWHSQFSHLQVYVNHDPILHLVSQIYSPMLFETTGAYNDTHILYIENLLSKRRFEL